MIDNHQLNTEMQHYQKELDEEKKKNSFHKLNEMVAILEEFKKSVENKCSKGRHVIDLKEVSGTQHFKTKLYHCVYCQKKFARTERKKTEI